MDGVGQMMVGGGVAGWMGLVRWWHSGGVDGCMEGGEMQGRGEE